MTKIAILVNLDSISMQTEIKDLEDAARISMTAAAFAGNRAV